MSNLKCAKCGTFMENDAGLISCPKCLKEIVDYKRRQWEEMSQLKPIVLDNLIFCEGCKSDMVHFKSELGKIYCIRCRNLVLELEEER